ENGNRGPGAPDRRSRPVARRFRAWGTGRRAAAGLPAARSDRQRGSGSATRPLEPAQTLRALRARPPALYRPESVRVERLHLADRITAADPSADAETPPREHFGPRTLDARLPRAERGFSALRVARARAAGAATRPRAGGPRRRARPQPPLVRKPPGGAVARGAAPPRRARGCGPQERPAGLGSGRAPVTEDRHSASAQGRADPRRAALPRARRPAGEGRMACAPRRERSPSSGPRHAAFAVRPPRARPRSSRGAVR